jgi:hypothetical protein
MSAKPVWNRATIRTPDGKLRVLGLIPSQIHCPGFLEAIAPNTGALVPRSQLQEFDAWPTWLPILDQRSWNACTYFASAQALMYARLQGGQPHVQLDPLHPYFAVTGGRNVGTNLIEASVRIAQLGIPPLHETTATAAAAARRFRFELSEQLTTFPQLLSAVARHRTVVGSICAGPHWMQLDGSDAPGVDRGQANHAIFLGGGLRKDPEHGWMLKHAGSWGTDWGDQGFAWYTEAHFDATRYGEAYVVRGVVEDSIGTVDPPPIPQD